MVNRKEILRLYAEGFSLRQIAASTGNSRNTVSETIEAAKAQGAVWPIEESTSNEQLESILFPNKYMESRSRQYLEPNYAHIHTELAKPGVTLTLLWEEYRQTAEQLGKKPYMTTQFGDKYRTWARITKATMRIHHKPGDAMEVDWAGQTLPIYDSMTGDVTPAYLFVAVLPCSGYAYAEPTCDMKLENWLDCHIHAYEYFEGATRLLIPDNLKTGVTKNTRYETVLNRSYEELAVYYDTAIVPARVEHPKDKSHAEGTVKMASTWILAALRNERFFTLFEAKEAVKQRLEELNHRPFTAKEGCRRTAYLEEEKAFMRPLPRVRYELATWNPGISVGVDYLVSDGKNKYSVPFDLIGEKVDIRLTSATVEVFFHGNRVASHIRKAVIQKEPIVNPDHMKPEHRKYLNYTADDFTVWAKSVGENTTRVVEYFLSAGKEAEQGFKACASLTKLVEKHGAKRVEEVCESVLRITSSPSVRLLSSALKNRTMAHPKTPPASDTYSNAHGITRGAAYYSRNGKDGEDK